MRNGKRKIPRMGQVPHHSHTRYLGPCGAGWFEIDLRANLWSQFPTELFGFRPRRSAQLVAAVVTGYRVLQDAHHRSKPLTHYCGVTLILAIMKSPRTVELTRNTLAFSGQINGLGDWLRFSMHVRRNLCDQFIHVPEYSTANFVVRQVTEPTLYQVQPKCIGRSKMNMKTRIFRQPHLHRFAYMRRVVVNDQVQRRLNRASTRQGDHLYYITLLTTAGSSLFS